jgi:uncharacterized protein YjfI (DUF2170 family)
MKAKSSAHYQRQYRKRLRELGLVKKEVWIRPEHAQALSQVEKQLRQAQLPGELINGAFTMTDTSISEQSRWHTHSLYEALLATELVTSGQANVELVEGVEPALHITMAEYGNLPVFLTVVGEQIIVESLLWAAEDIRDQAGFNDAILRTHKYFPLSTISLDTMGSQGDYYQMFGALSSSSLLKNIIFEIEVLASNVIHCAEAYSEFLVEPILETAVDQ